MENTFLPNGRHPYTDWMIRLKYAFIAMGLKKPLRLDWFAFRHFYDDGFTPIEAALIDIQEGGE